MSHDLEPGLIRLNSGIAHALKNIRKTASLSQTDLAKMVGVNQSCISRIERMDCDSFSLSTLFRIFDKMNLDLEIHVTERVLPTVDQPLTSV